MLVGKRLGRRHQRRLIAGFNGAQHGEEGNDRLTHPDLAHQQALHRALGSKIRVELAQSTGLIACELERERVDPALDLGPTPSQRNGDRTLLTILAPRCKYRLMEHKLLKRQPLACLLSLGRRRRKVHRNQRIGHSGRAA